MAGARASRSSHAISRQTHTKHELDEAGQVLLVGRRVLQRRQWVGVPLRIHGVLQRRLERGPLLIQQHLRARSRELAAAEGTAVRYSNVWHKLGWGEDLCLNCDSTST